MNNKINKTYQEITNIIVDSLEDNTLPWRKPWTGSTPNVGHPKRHNGQSYNGINVVVLWVMAFKNNYSSPYWMTYNQAKELNANVKKGEKSTPVFYSSTLTKEVENSNGDKEEISIPYRKSYRVFNADQIEGLPEKYYVKNDPIVINNNVEKIAEIENFIKATKAIIKHKGNQPCYIPSVDEIHIPNMKTFITTEGYYTTLFHEMTHWTMHKDRCNRDFKNNKTTLKEAYAIEELVSELGACFIASEHQLMIDFTQDHVPYIASWIKALKNDYTLIFKASSHAQKSTNFLFNKNNADLN